MATISLDQLREDVNRKYGDFEVELDGEHTCRLRNALRLNKDERNQLRSLQKRYDNIAKEEKLPEDDLNRRSDGEIEEAFTTVLFEQIRLLAENKPSVNKLLKAVGDDQAMLMHIVQQYMEITQPGELEPE